MTISDDCKDLDLQAVIGFSGSVLGGLHHTPCGQYIVYPLGSVVVMKSVSSNKNTFFDAGLDQKVSCVAISKDGKYLAAGHESSAVAKVEATIWDLQKAIQYCEEGKIAKEKDGLLHCLRQHHMKVQALDFNCDGTHLITLGGRDDNDLVIWDVKTGIAICGCPAANDTTLCVKWFNQRHDRFVTCGNYHFRVWQVCVNTPKIHAVDVNMGSMRRIMQCLSISSDDAFGFAGTKTGEVLKVRLDREEIKPFDQPNDLQPTLQGYNKDRLSMGVKTVQAVVNPNTGNTNVFAGAGDGTIQLLNPNLKLIESHRAELSGAVTSISLDPSSKHILVGTEYSQRYSIDISTFTPSLRGTCHYAAIYDIKFPRLSSEIFATASVEDIRVWNMKQRQELLRIRVPNLSCYAIDITQSGSSILSAWSDGKIRAFFPESGKVKFVISDAHLDSATAITSCNDDDSKPDWRIVSGGEDGGVRVWKISKSHQQMVHSMKEHRGTVNAVVCNAGGTQVISASSDRSCIVWDIINGVRIHALFESTVFTSVLFHPDESQYLTCGTDYKIGYWDAFDGSAIRIIEGSTKQMTCLDIEPRGNMFVSGSADKTVKTWHYDDGVTYGVGKGHSGKINSIAISPDQRNIVSVGDEGGIFIWDVSKIKLPPPVVEG